MEIAPLGKSTLARGLRGHRNTLSIVAVSIALCWSLIVAGAVAATPVLAPSTPGNSADAPFGFRTVAGAEGGAVLNVDSGMTFGSIQDAVDAATAGDTLQVVVPTLIEGQVMIDRSLTLEGATGSEVVLMGVDTGEVGDDRAWFLVDPGVTLDVRDLSFDGNGFLVFQAFRHRGGGTFERTNFNDINYSTMGNQYQGTAIVAFGDNVDVSDSTFTDIGRVGILFFGTGLTDSSVSNSSYTGKGDGDFLDYAWEAGSGAVVQVENTVVRDCRGVALADGSASAGVLVTTFFGPGTAMSVTGSTLVDSLSGAALGTGDPADTALGIFEFNRIVGNDTGIQQTSSTPAVAENNWWGCNDGPGAAGCDTTDGAGAIDTDPWLQLAVAVEDNVVLVSSTTNAAASLTGNSDGVDTGGLGWVTDDTPVAFDAGALGTMTPVVAGTFEGVAESEFLGLQLGDGVIQATVDNQTVEVDISVVAIVEIPTLGSFGLLLLVATLLVLGVRRLSLT